MRRSPLIRPIPPRRSRRAARWMATGAALSLLGACATVPDLGARPQPAAASAVAAQQTLGQGTADWPTERWWQGYGDPVLAGLIEEALAGSPDLAVADARLAKARAVAEQAGAALAPQVSASGSAQLVKQSLNDGFPPQFVPKGYQDRGRVGLDIAYALDLAGAGAKRRRAALGEARAVAVEAQAARLSLATAIADRYAQLAMLAADRRLAEQSVSIRENSARLVALRAREGLDTQGRVAQSASTVPAARADLAALDQSIALVRNQLAALLGQGPDRGLAIPLPAAPIAADRALPANLPLDLVGRRPDIVAARLRVEAAAERVGAARADFYPSVNLMGFIGFQSLGLGNLLSAGSDVGQVGPAISLPIFSGGRLQGAYRGARADYDLAVADYDRTLLTAVREVADAAATATGEAAQRREAQAALDQAERAHRIAVRRYQGGLADYLSVLTSEDSLLVARRRVADLEARRLSSDVALVRALGGGFVSSAS